MPCSSGAQSEGAGRRARVKTGTDAEIGSTGRASLREDDDSSRLVKEEKSRESGVLGILEID
jgi:hypothetical protein